MVSAYRRTQDSLTIVWVSPEEDFECGVGEYVVMYRMMVADGKWVKAERPVATETVQKLEGLQPGTYATAFSLSFLPFFLCSPPLLYSLSHLLYVC